VSDHRAVHLMPIASAGDVSQLAFVTYLSVAADVQR
jgi:hypothetical protein